MGSAINAHCSFIIFLQETSSGFKNTDGLEEEISKVLENINAEKGDEEVKVDMWCHFGHAYITKVDEGEYGNLIFGAITLFVLVHFFAVLVKDL